MTPAQRRAALDINSEQKRAKKAGAPPPNPKGKGYVKGYIAKPHVVKRGTGPSPIYRLPSPDQCAICEDPLHRLWKCEAVLQYVCFCVPLSLSYA
jgi:hypothetical protein